MELLCVQTAMTSERVGLGRAGFGDRGWGIVELLCVQTALNSEKVDLRRLGFGDRDGGVHFDMKRLRPPWTCRK